jgi:predicted ATPase
LAPWQDIFKSDSERYENFEQAIQIHDHLVDTYTNFGYHLIDVPFGSVKKRTDFILDALTL